MEQNTYTSNKFRKFLGHINDKSYIMGRELTRMTDKIIPGKRERRDYALRTRINQLLDGELSDEELTKLGFQASGVKSDYTAALGFTAVGFATLNPIIFICAAGAGTLGVLHQLAMSKGIKEVIEELPKEEREKLKELIKEKDVYEFRDILYKELKF
jgi:hypothetical protein